MTNKKSIENSHQDIGKAIRRLRKHYGLSIDLLSHISGVSPKTISFIERGKVANPGYYTVCKLLNAMKEELYIGISLTSFINNCES